MKPPPFDYCRPECVEEVLDLLAETGEDACVLAGGQSLVPLLNMRLVRPGRLIDINALEGERYLTITDDTLAIGCLARHMDFEDNPDLNARLAILGQAAKEIASPAVRNRGTFCGSLCHNDPAAEWPLMAVLLDARMHIQSATGERVQTASGGEGILPSHAPRGASHSMTSAPVGANEGETPSPPRTPPLSKSGGLLEPGELLQRVEIPLPPAHAGWSFAEFNRRPGDVAIVSAAAMIGIEHGRIANASLALGGAAGTAIRLREVERLLEGETPSDALWSEAAARIGALDPPTDLQATSAFRRHLAEQLTRRVLVQAASRCTPGGEGVSPSHAPTGAIPGANDDAGGQSSAPGGAREGKMPSPPEEY